MPVLSATSIGHATRLLLVSYNLCLCPIIFGLTSSTTCLPLSVGHTTMVGDQFSKMAHFVPLPKLSTAKETAKLVLVHIFRLHCLPTDVVSNRGVQITSGFWKEFCTLIGAIVSLSSGIRPEYHDQLCLWTIPVLVLLSVPASSVPGF